MVFHSEAEPWFKYYIVLLKVRKVIAFAGADLIKQTVKPGKKDLIPPFAVYL